MGFCVEFTVWHFATKCAAVKFVNPWMSSHFSSESRDPSYVGSSMRPECPRKDSRGKSCWLHPRESDQEVVQRPAEVTDLTWSHLSVEPTELSEIAADYEVFRVHLGLLFPRPVQRISGRENQWMNGKNYDHWPEIAR